VYLFKVTLKVHPTKNTGSTSLERRRATADDLLDALTSWGPRERMNMLTSWHRGSLSLIHLLVLTILEAEGSLSMSHLAEALDVSVASATGIVDRLERRGLVARHHSTDDRRVILVRLTDQGRTVFSHLEQLRRARLTLLVEGLSDDELRGFLTGLRAMRAAARRLPAADRAARAAER
jgi:DNA-binding MarR family transcriptional regulator